MNYSDWPVSTNWGSGAYTWSGDFNGDGLLDIASANGASVYMKLSTGSGFVSTPWNLPDGNWGSSGYTWAADFNGDGRTDIASAVGATIYLRLSNGNGFDSITSTLSNRSWGSSDNTWVGDYNGDNLADIASSDGAGNIYVKLSTGSGFTERTWLASGMSSSNWGGNNQTWAKDINGDGLTDILTISEISKINDYGDRTYTSVVHTLTSTGSGNSGFAHNSYIMDTIRAQNYGDLEDVNADGLPDLIIGYNNDEKLRLALRQGGFGSANVWDISPTWTSLGFYYNANATNFFADYDGDGFLDLTGNSPWSFALSANAKHDVITNVTSGVGSKVTITYKMLSEGYTAGSCPGYPVICTPSPVQVVSAHTVDDAIGSTSSFDYKYYDARIHTRGRGFLGFNKTEIADNQTGVRTTTIYANDQPQSPSVIDTYPDRYPYAGMASYQIARQFSQPVTEQPGRVYRASVNITNVYDSMNVTQFALKETAPGVYFPYVRTKEEQHWETNGQLVSTTTTTTDYDNFGNATQIGITNTDGTDIYTKTTVNTYDSTQLRLGRLKRAVVTSATPDGIGVRTSSFTYYSDGLLKSETIEPDKPDTSPLKQTTTYDYDSFGNKTKATVRALAGSTAASGLQNRVTQTIYDAYGLFPIKSIKTLGANDVTTQVETYTYEPRHGARTQLIGPNGLATNWEYDDFGRMIRESRADGTETVTRYAWCGATCPNGGTKIIQETAGAPRTVVYKDIEDREIRSETDGLRPGSLIIQDTTYDRYGRIIRKSRPYYQGETPQEAVFYYDIQDRVVEEDAPDGGKKNYSYTPLKKTITTNIVGGDIAQTTRVETYDVLNRLRSVVENGVITTTYAYDALDNQVKVTDNAGNVTTIVPDIRGRKIAMIDPDMGSWSYQYNGFGELVSQTDAKGQTISMTYDTLGRMITRTEPEGVTQWVYDTALHGVGKLAYVTGPNNYRKTLSYDGFGRLQTDIRLISDVSMISGQTYALDYTYDRFGRALETVYPTGFTTKNVYDTNGYQLEVRNAANDALYWQADDADADGQITQETYGNNLQTVRTFDPASGRLDLLTTGTAGNVQFLDFTFDTAGNLQSRARSEGGTSLLETFDYDNLQRLKTATINGIGAKNFDYDTLGNIKQKGTATDYLYGERGAGPHAVTRAGGKSYDYDANGNMVSGASRSISWNSSNKPTLITKGQTTVRFDYGPNRARYRQIKTVGAETTTTVYLGKIYEQVTKGTSVEDKHYIVAGGKVIAIYTEKTATAPTTHYLHHDHLGSVDVITNESGAVLERTSFSPFGMRRSTADWSDVAGLTSQFTTRGFTGHEQLDEVGLVHMNGRVYDPLLGRFLSADPQVQFPTASQSFNRYSYVHNNPLSYTDPSGFGLFSKIKKAFKKVGSAIKKAFKSQVFRALVAITAAYFTYGALSGTWIWGAEYTASFAAGFVGGAISSGTLKGGLIGGVTAVAFYGVGSGFQQLAKGGWDSGAAYFGKVVAHGTVGGLSSVAQGGSFSDGFRSAGFTQFASPIVGTAPGGKIGRVAAAATVGGTTSKFGGGKFANGAVTGAYSRLFNDEGRGHGRNQRADQLRQRRLEVQGVQDETGFLAQFGVIGSFQLGVVGLSNFVSGVVTTSDQICTIVTTCVKAGPGFFIGVGGAGSGGVYDGRLAVDQESLSFGGFAEGGQVLGGGISFDISKDSLSAAGGFGGGAEGLAAGVQMCGSRVTSCSDIK